MSLEGPAAAPKSTIARRVAEDLRGRVVRGELPPGGKINLDGLREAYSVSTSSLREAVARLVASGLVVAEDQRGFRVAPVSLANLDEVTLLRAELEPMALGSAIRNGDLDWETDVTAALYRLGRIKREPGEPSSIEAWEEAHSAFHVKLIQRCDMPVLMRFCRNLLDMSDRYRRIYLDMWSGQERVAAEHKAIAEAAVTRQADAACDLLRAHIERTGRNLHGILSDSIGADGA